MIGFIGLGVMGTPMALNLVRSGTPLIVWNRTSSKCDPLARAGARVAESADDVFANADIVLLMLADEASMDAVLERGTAQFAHNVADRIVVHMGTTSPEYSKSLADDVRNAGGAYVESPVSGSRGPAQRGELIAMIAGESPSIEAVRDVVRPMCRETILCGPVPNALLMKLSVNIFLVATMCGLAEAVQFAQQNGLDMQQFRAAIDAGPMASSVARGKLEKLIAGDYSVEAALTDAFKNSRLMSDAARYYNVATPLLDVGHALFGEAVKRGAGNLDMAAVLFALHDRTELLRNQ